MAFWFDNADDGRYLALVRTERSGADWVTVVPAGHGDLVSAVRRALSGLGVGA